MRYTVSEIADRIGGEVRGDGSVALTGVAPADQAQAEDLTFAENDAYFALAQQSAAGAILAPPGSSSASKTLIVVPKPRLAMARVLQLFFPEPSFEPGIHSAAIVAQSARVHPTAHIGPYCVVGEGAEIGARSVLEGSDHVGPHCVVGEDVRLFPRVTLYAHTRIGNRVRLHSGVVVGSDGFGYVFEAGKHVKIPQVGNAIVGDDVEIGANVTVDRGALGPTVIGKGTKIDNLVQVAHNVTVGEHCLLVAQVGIAGSTSLGDYVTLAGQVGIAGHLRIGNRVTVGAQSGVMNDIPDGEKWLGSPARAMSQIKRQYIAIERLPDLLKRVTKLERQAGAGGESNTPPPAAEQAS